MCNEPLPLQPQQMHALGMDLFTTLIRIAFLMPRNEDNTVNAHDLMKSLQIMFPIVVLQAMVTIQTRDRSTINTWTANDEFTALYDLVTKHWLAHNTNKEGEVTMTTMTRESLEKEVKELCLPFMWRTAMFINSCNFSGNFSKELRKLFEKYRGTVEQNVGGDGDEYGELAALLQLPTTLPSAVINLHSAEHHLSNWFGNHHQVCGVSLPRKFKLMQLEESFETLLAKYKGKPCCHCGGVNANMGLCLHCGSLMCVGAEPSPATVCNTFICGVVWCGV